ncbi:hypothetical protein KSZ_75790 [Dictyobacter formicarum]|uniref:Uncharacterized protein n=1 Tax=Dictyobacter formicarum TaxID=2778368 RepID=A0ABQ3VVI2_9CHLR|nr:hypothetical protein KSZ_75790 [Dictyobacter formicarum]
MLGAKRAQSARFAPNIKKIGDACVPQAGKPFHPSCQTEENALLVLFKQLFQISCHLGWIEVIAHIDALVAFFIDHIER